MNAALHTGKHPHLVFTRSYLFAAEQSEVAPGKFMTCKLCEKDRPLGKSHIFPEWLYTPIYDEDGGIFDRSMRKIRNRRTRPVVLYERLFCEECEQRIGKWEGYAHDVFFGDDPRLKLADLGSRFVVSGVKYAPFKLFQMSLIWRASISNRPEVHRINLGPHAERLRKILMEACPGENHKYGSILFFPSLSIQQMTQDFIDPPERAPYKFHGHTAYRGIFGGVIWMFIVSNHSEVLPNEMFLSENGRLPFFVFDVPAVESNLEMAFALGEGRASDEPT